MNHPRAGVARDPAYSAPSRALLLSFALAVVALSGPTDVRGQVEVSKPDVDFGRAEELRLAHPDLHALIDRLDEAHARMLDHVVARGEPVVAPGPAAERYAVLGSRGAAVIQWGRAFQREVLAALASTDVDAVGGALDEAVRRYRARPEIALPVVPKDMDVLYVHPHALALRTEFADLDGSAWAGQWLRLAATEPLTDFRPGQDRDAAVESVMARYFSKLSSGEPPESFPTELPLAPAIAPGLIWSSPESAVIWDNLSMLLEVLGDVLASAQPGDVAPAVESALDYFLDPDVGVTTQDEWEIMALRHGIFFQGGFPLAVMTGSERNVGGHAAHGSGGAMLRTMPGMPRR